jgi:thioester reductase-like protein
MSDPRGIFMTGATGGLGQLLVREILRRSGDRLFLLVREKRGQSHRARTRSLLAAAGLEDCLDTRVQILTGDVALPGLGLDAAGMALLRREITHVFHVAALTTLNARRAECDRINLGGTEAVVKLAWDLRRHGRLERLVHFSTAYAVGSRQAYHSSEDVLPAEPRFANHYESSKYRAEQAVREAMAQGLPATIFRPSIVAGDSQTGEVTRFNVIYPFIKLFSLGILSTLPTHPENTVNIVPVDFVVRAALYLSGQPGAIGRTYHLVTQRPLSVGTLLQLAASEYPGLPPVRIVAPDRFHASHLSFAEKTAFRMLEPYLGYLNEKLTFDTTNTEQALRTSEIDFPSTDVEYLKVLCRYAVEQGYFRTPSTGDGPSAAKNPAPAPAEPGAVLAGRG